MAYSYTRKSGDGTTTVFTFNFDYMKEGDIGVKVDGVAVPFTFQTANTVEITPAPANGAVVEIRRTTDVKSPVVDYRNGSVLSEYDLDLQAKQVLMVAQEVADDLFETITKDSLGNFDAKASRIVNVADPIHSQDVVNKAWIDAEFRANMEALEAQAGTHATNAAASAAAAGVSEVNAKASEGAASLHEVNALTARNEAESYANSVGQFDVVRTATDFTVAASNNGNLIAVDASAGPVAVTLPLVADVGEPFTLRVKKVDGSANDVTVTASGTDTIDDSAAPYVLNIAAAGAVFSADIDTAPDHWQTAAFGASSKLARREFVFTATEGQTVFSGTDDAGNTLTYSAVGLEVYLNGVRLPPSDYTATDGASITLAEAAAAGDELYAVVTGSFDVADTYTTSEIDTKLLALFPVGAIYINADGADPATFIGGTWTQIGQGRTLIGAGTGTDDGGAQRTFTAGDTGGEYDHTLTVGELPAHGHPTMSASNTVASGSGANGFAGGGTVPSGSEIGSDQAHNNVMPYLAVYFWQRTA